MIPRTLEASLHKAAKNYPAITVTGPRQSGKTTLMFAMPSRTMITSPWKILSSVPMPWMTRAGSWPGLLTG